MELQNTTYDNLTANSLCGSKYYVDFKVETGISIVFRMTHARIKFDAKTGGKEIVGIGDGGEAKLPRPQPQEMAQSLQFLAGRGPEQFLWQLQYITVYSCQERTSLGIF